MSDRIEVSLDEQNAHVEQLHRLVEKVIDKYSLAHPITSGVVMGVASRMLASAIMQEAEDNAERAQAVTTKVLAHLSEFIPGCIKLNLDGKLQ